MVNAPDPPGFPPPNLWAPTLAAVTGSVMVGFMPLMARHLYAEGMSAPSMLVWRYTLALVPLGLSIAVMRLDIRAAWRQGAWQIVIIGATLGAAQTLCYWESIKTLDTSIAVLLFYTYPALTLALDRLVLRRPIRARSVGSIAIILFGAGLITLPGLRGGAIDLVGLAWAIPGPMIYSIYLVLTTSRLRRQPPLIGASCLYLGLTITFEASALFTDLDWPADAPTWGLLAFIAIGPGALMVTLFSYSVPKLGPTSYAITANSELVTTVAVGVVVLGEPVTFARAVGGAMIVTGILAHSLFRATAPRAVPKEVAAE
ncbi:MAG TPA: DMT family transporter [Stellaceae bacterium]|jgi:drug/metabolite transporter (DMT)-like permease|nr:DMT family transporter [Stellaceae bacterium]